MDLSYLNFKYLEDLYAIKISGYVDIASENSDCSNFVYYCNIGGNNITEIVGNRNNYKSIEECKIYFRDRIYVLKNDENIFHCIVKSLNDNDKIVYSTSRIIERRINTKTVRNIVKHHNFKYNIDLSNLDFLFDDNSNILKVFGIIYSKPEKLCKEDTNIKTISCKVSTYSYSANDYGLAKPLSSFNCSGTTISATAEFEYPNYFACAVSDNNNNNMLSFQQIKTKYYNKNTDNHNNNHNNNNISGIIDAVYGIAVLIAIIICCCISCCCYKFCKRKNKVSSEIQMTSQPVVQQNYPQIVNAIPIQPYPYNNNNIPVQGIPYNPQPYYPNTYDQQQQQPYIIQQPPQNGVINDPNNQNVVNMNYYQQQQPQENETQPIYYSQPIYQPIV